MIVALPDRPPLHRLPGLDRREPLPRSARDARPPPLPRVAARGRCGAAGRAHRSRLRHLRARGRVLRQRRVDRRVRAHARAAAVHVARVPLQARRASLEADRPGRHPDRRLQGERPDLLPGDRRLVDRHGPLAGAPPRRRRAGLIDVIGDIVESANLVIRHPRTASVVLGGGTPKNFINQASVQAGVLRRPDRRPPLRAADRDRRAALRRRVRLQPRRGAQLGQAGRPTRSRSPCTPTRRSRCRCSSARWPAPRGRHARRGASRCSFDLSGPTMSVNGRPFPHARFEAR